MIPVSIASSTAGVLRFLARLSGRRRQRHVRSQSGPGAAASGGGGGGGGSGGDGSGGDSRPAAAAAAAGQCELVTPVAAAMEGSEERQLYYCCRCRGQRCSCAALGLDELDGEQEQQQHRCSSEQARTKERTNTTNTTTTTTTSSSQHRFRKQQWRTDCGCAADRDVLRRRPPEQKSHAAAAFGFAAATSRSMIPPYLATLLILSYSLVGVADACSSRSTPKPRPPTPTPRPNITFHMYTCQPDYAEWYCLNGATCFTVKIVDSLLYNCLCANGFIGQRCEFKDLDGTYLPTRQRVMLETASIAGAVTIAVFLAVITFISVYIHCKRKQKELRTSSGVDVVDGPGRDPELRPFCSRIFNAKNPNSLVGPSIEHTRMPNWNFPPETSTRMVSVNENKRPGQ